LMPASPNFMQLLLPGCVQRMLFHPDGVTRPSDNSGVPNEATSAHDRDLRVASLSAITTRGSLP
jgi:hypothetical protein